MRLSSVGLLVVVCFLFFAEGKRRQRQNRKFRVPHKHLPKTNGWFSRRMRPLGTLYGRRGHQENPRIPTKFPSFGRTESTNDRESPAKPKPATTLWSRFPHRFPGRRGHQENPRIPTKFPSFGRTESTNDRESPAKPKPATTLWSRFPHQFPGRHGSFRPPQWKSRPNFRSKGRHNRPNHHNRHRFSSHISGVMSRLNQCRTVECGSECDEMESCRKSCIARCIKAKVVGLCESNCMVNVCPLNNNCTTCRTACIVTQTCRTFRCFRACSEFMPRHMDQTQCDECVREHCVNAEEEGEQEESNDNADDEEKKESGDDDEEQIETGGDDEEQVVTNDDDAFPTEIYNSILMSENWNPNFWNGQFEVNRQRDP